MLTTHRAQASIMSPLLRCLLTFCAYEKVLHRNPQHSTSILGLIWNILIQNQAQAHAGLSHVSSKSSCRVERSSVLGQQLPPQERMTYQNVCSCFGPSGGLSRRSCMLMPAMTKLLLPAMVSLLPLCFIAPEPPQSRFQVRVFKRAGLRFNLV